MEQNKIFEEAAVQEAVKGYKVFNPDWTCRYFQYKVGKIFEEDVEPSCCDRGFHFCLKTSDCFNYYRFDSNNKVAEVVALGAVDYSGDDSKACTNKIQIVREIPWQELLTIVNTGKDCTGICNTGNRNSCNHSTGCFCTEEQPIMLFNKPSPWSYSDWINSDARYLLNRIPKNVVEWIYSKDMTDEEKAAHPSHKTTGGYLKVLDESECGQIWWDGLSEHNRNIIRALPNFDPVIFEQVTGIKILPDDVTE